jgi:hypothetical protein
MFMKMKNKQCIEDEDAISTNAIRYAVFLAGTTSAWAFSGSMLKQYDHVA